MTWGALLGIMGQPAVSFFIPTFIINGRMLSGASPWSASSRSSKTSWPVHGKGVGRQGYSLRPLPDQPSEDFIEAFAALHQDNLNLPLILSDAVGNPVFGFAKPEMMRAQALEGWMECRRAIRRSGNFPGLFLNPLLKGRIEFLVQAMSRGGKDDCVRLTTSQRGFPRRGPAPSAHAGSLPSLGDQG